MLLSIGQMSVGEILCHLIFVSNVVPFDMVCFVKSSYFCCKSDIIDVYLGVLRKNSRAFYCE